MQDDPAKYWQDLTDNYRQMSDGELLQLAEKPEELTEVAQQVLRDEMKLRKLTLAQPELPKIQNPTAAIHREPSSYRYEFSEHDGDEGASEFTWKTQLCECETAQQAGQLAEALRRAGIDTWIQGPTSRSRALDVTYPRVLVAADQLEQAQAIAAQPIPQDIVDESRVDEESEPEYFEIPKCPKCGAPDPVLESADPVNTWSCETCGAEWSDAEPTSAEDADETSFGRANFHPP